MNTAGEFQHKSNHFSRIDCLKGLGIIGMVLGHSGAPFTKFIYLFHMALFFMCSGYCWNDKHAQSFKSVAGYVGRKLTGLYIPYVGSNVIFVLLHNFFIRMGIYTSDIAYSQIPGMQSYFVCQEYFQISDIFKGVLKTVCFMGGTQMGGATWFFRTLFFVACGHCAWIYIMNVLRSEKFARALQGILLLVCIGLSMLRWDSEIIASFFPAYIAYYMGIMLRKYEKEAMYGWIPGSVAVIVLLLMNPLGQIAMSKGDVTNPAFFLIVSLAGWIMLCAFSGFLTGKVRDMIIYLGKNTVPIVILHFLCLKIVTYVYISICKKEAFYLAAFPVIPNETGFLWIVYAFAGILIPLALNGTYKRFKRCIIKIC